MRMLLTIGFLCSSSLLTFPQVASTARSPQQQDRRIVHHNDGSSTATVFTYGHMPLQEAILTINEEYGWGINYEDVPTVNASELVDENAELRRLNQGFHEDLMDGLSPKAKPFSSTFTELDTRHADKDTVLQKLLSDYNSSPNPGKFRLERTAQNSYVVIGVKYKSETGDEVEYKPILDCPISLYIPPTNLHHALQLVAGEVNKTCANELHAKLTADYTAEDSKSLGTENAFGNFQTEPARNVIESLLGQDDRLLYYSVQYVAGINEYYLQTWTARKSVTGVDGKRFFDPISNSRVNDQ
jgi:hypothetical protein